MRAVVPKPVRSRRKHFTSGEHDAQETSPQFLPKRSIPSSLLYKGQMESAEITPALPINSTSTAPFRPEDLHDWNAFRIFASETSNSQPFMTNVSSYPTTFLISLWGGVGRTVLNAQTCARPAAIAPATSGHRRHLSAPTSAPLRRTLCRVPDQPYTPCLGKIPILKPENTYFGASKYLFWELKIPILKSQHTYFAAPPCPGQGRILPKKTESFYKSIV